MNYSDTGLSPVSGLQCMGGWGAAPGQCARERGTLGQARTVLLLMLRYWSRWLGRARAGAPALSLLVDTSLTSALAATQT